MTQPQVDELRPGDRFAKYTVQRKLGHGGFGAVYLVENDLGMRFALKLLHAEVAVDAQNRQRFLREMRIAMGITHEYAVPLRDADVWQDRLYYTMDFVQGQGLDAVLAAHGKQGVHPLRAIEWCRQVLQFLEFLHRRGFVHRDLKPANLMLEGEAGSERVRVLDLGIAKALSADADTTLLTSGQVIVGTPAYMAPEHLSGDPIDQRIDLYAVGVILYECLGGTRPFNAPTLQRLRRAVLEDAPRPLTEFIPHFPEQVWKVLERALEKDRERRFPDARSFLEALESATRVPPNAWGLATTLPLERSSPTPARRTNRPLLAGLGAVALLLAAGTAWTLFDPNGTEKPGSAEPLPSGAGEPPAPGPEARGPAPEVLAERAKSAQGSGVALPVDPPQSPAAPQVEVLGPRPGSLVGREGPPLELRIAGAGPFRLRMDGRIAELESQGDGRYGAQLTLPESDGEHTLAFEILDSDERASPASVSVVLDRTAPTLLEATPPDAARFDGAEALVTVVASEALGPASRIGAGGGSKIEGPRITARVGGSGATPVEILLVDLAGNRTLVPSYSLQFPCAKPTLELISPTDGARLRDESLELRLKVAGSGNYVFTLDELEFPVDSNGMALARIDLGAEGPREFRAAVQERGFSSTRVERTFSLHVDRTAPSSTLALLEPPGFVMPGTEVLLTLDASERLSPACAVPGALSMEAQETRLTARLPAQAGSTSVHVDLVDLAGNLRSVEVPLRIARIPAGFEGLPESRPDPDTGWISPIREPRTGIRLALVPPTKAEGFEMGAAPGDNDARADELPRHRVVLTRPFYLGVHEVSWEELFAGKGAGAFEQPAGVPDEGSVRHWTSKLPNGRVPADFPAVNLTWTEATEFCSSFGLQLPSEAQWEWACRKPVPTGRYSWGYDFAQGKSAANVSDRAAKFGTDEDPAAGFDDGHYYAAGPGHFHPTPLGLVHLTGNVLEWCRDAYDERTYAERAKPPGATVDPVQLAWRGPGAPSRVLRGGSFRHGAVESRLTRRFRLEETGRLDFVGFRVALELNPR